MNKTDEDLTEFLHGAESPRDRALVAVLMQLNRSLHETNVSLHENTRATTELAADFVDHRKEFIEHRKEFADHVTEERSLFAQGAGMYRALTTAVSIGGVLIAAIGALAWYILSNHLGTLGVAVMTNEQQERRLTVVEERQQDVRKRLESLESWLKAQPNGGR